MAGKLEGLTIRIARKAGMDGKLFGSVSNADVVDALAAQAVEIERSAVRMPDGALKQTGDHPLEVVLHAEVVATITVTVAAEQ
jgi:large subunit ribosomal protein L9